MPIVVPTAVKASPAAATTTAAPSTKALTKTAAKSFVKNPHLLKMLSNAAAADSANQDKLKQFLK